jgi:hypothetical protein
MQTPQTAAQTKAAIANAMQHVLQTYSALALCSAAADDTDNCAELQSYSALLYRCIENLHSVATAQRAVRMLADDTLQQHVNSGSVSLAAAVELMQTARAAALQKIAAAE